MEDVGTEARPGGCEEGAGEHRKLLEAGGKGSPMGPPGEGSPVGPPTL